MDLLELPLPRFVNAVMAWLRRQNVDGTEEGLERWKKAEAWVMAPPQQGTPGAVATPSKAAVARMTPEQEAAAFDAFASFTGA